MSYLTVVFKDAKPGSKEVADLLYHPQFAAGSWGHSIDDANFWRKKVEQMPSEVSMNIYAKVDDETVMIDGVKYQKVVEEKKPITLSRIIGECMIGYNNTVIPQLLENVVDRVEVEWLPKRYQSYSEYNDGWNDCLDELKRKLRNSND